jgi:hypothetical protein
MIATRFSGLADRLNEQDESRTERCQTTVFPFALHDGFSPPPPQCVEKPKNSFK